MNEITILNPDDFLGQPRIWTPERNKTAWEEIYSILEKECAITPSETTLYIIFGIQGAGKTTFTKRNPGFFLGRSFIIDAALPAARHRQRGLSIASKNGVRAEAIWIDTPLEVALKRNSLREPDQRVPDENIKNVFSLLEPPTLDEGFSRIHHIRHS